MKYLSLFILFYLICLTSGKFKLATVAIFGTNDIHVSAYPSLLFRSDFGQEYNYGGLEFMASMIDRMHKQYSG